MGVDLPEATGADPWDSPARVRDDKRTGVAMSFGEAGGGEIEFETVHGRSWPSVTQFSVFLENRVGQLLEVLRAFHGSKVKIVGLTISDAADCSILRLLLSHPEQGRELLSLSKLAFAENELIVVE